MFPVAQEAAVTGPTIAVVFACLFFTQSLIGQHACAASLSGYATDVPPLLDYSAEGTWVPRESNAGDCVGGCKFSWYVEVEITMPEPAHASTFELCRLANPGGYFCGYLTLNLSGGQPPYVYTFEYAAEDWEIPCGSSVQMDLYWNPGLGNIAMAGASMVRAGCL